MLAQKPPVLAVMRGKSGCKRQLLGFPARLSAETDHAEHAHAGLGDQGVARMLRQMRPHRLVGGGALPSDHQIEHPDMVPLARRRTRGEILRAGDRGFRITADPGDLPATRQSRMGQREALIGGTEPDADNHAVWTTNPSLVDTATNHIILDITLMARDRDREADCEAVVSPMMRPHLMPLYLSGQLPPAAAP